ncbi:MAG: carbohydrate-binding domain-containing protein [Clostridiales Family XIII bacterium]|jgi:hypothetical protein|nr:carbohydrate-binding domain-containing protein [Clostridiales Family XIII bacterium]
MAIHKKFSKIAGLALMLALFVLSFANYAAAVGEEENVRVILNGAELTFDVPAQIINGRTMVPMRGIFEALGAQIGWDDATNTVTAAKGDTKITLAIGDSVAYKNGAAMALDVPALIVDSRSLAPLRFVGEALGAQVEWSEETRTVRIVSSDTTAPAVAEEDLDSSWDSAATKINLNQSSVSIDGAGATAAGSVVTITEAGTYVVSGSLLDGQIAVAATKDDLVRIVLNSADITNGKGAPIDASKCGKLILILAAGTQNNLTDGGTGFAYRDEAEQEPNAAVFAKNDLTINGTGALTVNAGFNNGIGAKDNLLVVSGAIAVNAANHGLRGNDSVTVLGGDLNIRSGNDGIQTNNEEDADKGWIAIAGGAITIVSGHDGIQADTNLRVSGGEFHVTAGGGVSEAQTITSSDSTSDSYKGMKATGDVVITEGRFAIDSADDAVHANGSIYISGGEFALSTGDDGVHADKELNVDGGNIAVTKSYEGLEAANINISGGIANIVASDDGINAAGGSDGNYGRRTFWRGQLFGV